VKKYLKNLAWGALLAIGALATVASVDQLLDGRTNNLDVAVLGIFGISVLFATVGALIE
jgi:branched-subunit amino acid ABC-type transport system permease component